MTMLPRRKRLGDLLIEAGLIQEQQLNKALEVQKRTGERLGKVLINLGYITEERIIEVLEFQLGVPHLDLMSLHVPREVAALIPVSLAERYQVVPVQKEGKIIKLAMVDPTNYYAIEDVRMVTGCEVQPVIASERSIMQIINQSFGVQDLVDKVVDKLRPEDVALISELETADDAPIISIVNSIIAQAVKNRASDIHIEPLDKSLRIRFRIDGVLREISTFPKHIHPAILSRIKIMSSMDIAEKRLPQDGRIKIQEFGRDIDIRVSTLPTITGEKVVMRILDKQTVILNVTGLGVSKANLPKFRQLYSQSYGMVLVTGPTGSGKSTTLYSVLADVNAPGMNIITVEDPVEYRLEGINQVQVNQKAGLTFANGLRSILRQDPNVIMVGEVRDTDTADIAIRAALTGHLVFTTLHTNDASGAVTRLVDMGVEPFLVASSVLGVVAQRLVRTICSDCKQKYFLPPDAPERLFLGVEKDTQIELYRGTGCPRCDYTGYRGRMAIHEIMVVSPQLRDAINKRLSSDEIKVIAMQEGMTTMKQDGIDKVFQGLTTIEEVIRVAYSGL